ncbi:MAG: DUF6443 domain-containing protein, partial [Bacteroidota bacterium]
TIIGHDGQVVNYDYDRYGRLANIFARDSNITTNHGYFYPDPARTGFERAHVTAEINYTPVTGSDFTTRSTYTYIDGLGRTKQTVDKAYAPVPFGQTSTPKDVVQTSLYDEYGRQTQVSERFASSSTTGAYVPNIPTGIFTTSTNYEDSPFNRVTGVLPPDWPYEAKTEYGNNELIITVANFTYPPNTLTTTVAIDPNDPNWKTIEYKDKRGRLIMSRRQSGSGAPVDTKYTYDDKDRVTTIIPPGADANDDELVYKYVYDERDRVTRKKIPGQAWMDYAYEERDLPTYVRDGNQKLQGRWLHTHYDEYGREKITGLITTGGNPDGNQELPISTSETLVQNTYDEGATSDPIYYGKLTSSNTKILDTDDGLIRSRFTYDEYGRISLESYTYLLPIGEEYPYNKHLVSHTYDFADNLLSSENKYFQPGGVTPALEYSLNFSYDHSGRLIDEKILAPFADPSQIHL